MFNGKRVGVCISSFVYDQTSLQQIKHSVMTFVANSTLVDEIYVTDDCSPYIQSWAAYEEMRNQGVKIIRNHKNRGIGAMKNLALRLLGKCDILFLVDADTYVNNGWDSFYLNGLEVTKHQSVNLCNIFNDNQPFRQQTVSNYVVNYHSKYQGAFMCVTKEALKGVGGFPLLPQRYGCEHYNWQVRLARSLGMEPCVLDFEGGRNFVINDHKANSFITASEKEKQSIANGTKSNAILHNKVNFMPNEIEANGERGESSAIIIPFRAASWSYQGGENSDRTANLLAVLDYYKSILPNVEITVVEQDRQPVIQSKLRGDVKYLFLKNASTFNKCWAYNCAVKNTEKPYLIFMDSDAIIKQEPITASIASLRCCAVYKPYVKFLDLSEPLSTKFRNAMTFTWSDHSLRQRCATNDWFTGGCVMVRRKEYFQIGGFNEKFRGWGGEDDEFIARAKTLVPTGRISGNHNLYHLHHLVPTDATDNHPLYQGNLAELYHIGSMNNSQIVDYVNKEMVPNMGNSEKYANE